MRHFRQKSLYIALSAALGISACGGSGSDQDSDPDPIPTTYSISGFAIDGLLQGADVCIDTNQNYACDTGELTGTTQTDGTYGFTGLTTRPSGQVLVIASATTTGNETGKTLYLSAEIPASGDLDTVVVSPLTTLLNSGQISESDLVSQLGLPSVTDLNALYTEGSETHKRAKAIADKLASDLSEKLTNDVSVSDVLDGTEGSIYTIANAINDATATLTEQTLIELLESLGAQANASFVDNVNLQVALKNTSDAAIPDASIMIEVRDSSTHDVAESDDGSVKVVATTDAQGRVLITLPKYNLESVDIHAAISKEGYVTQQKVFTNVINGAEIQSNLTLQEEIVSTFKVTDEGSLNLGEASAATSDRRSLSFALVKMPNGDQVIVGGDAVAQAMNDEDQEVSVGVSIPVNQIDTDTVTAITAGIRGFDPNDRTDVQSFPGTFQGTGEIDNVGVGVNTERLSAGQAQAANEEGTYQLISASFAQIRLNDQNGNDIELVDPPEASAANDDENPTITLRVPEESYSAITEDMDTSLDNIQAPIYVYRWNQGWVLIGLGTLVTYDGTDYIPLVDNDLDDGIQSDVDVYVLIEIVEGNEWIQWVNLDYPIKAGTLEDVTFTGTFKYEARNITDREDFSGSAQIDYPNGSQEWVNIDRGILSYTALLNSNEVNGTALNIWNDRIRAYESFNAVDDGDPATDNTYTFDPDPGILTNPLMCQVTGTVINAGNEEMAGYWMYIYNSDYSFYTSLSTDATGTYTAAIPCEQDLNLYTSWSGADTVLFNANNAVVSPETSDTESTDGTVTLEQIQLPNQTPSIWASAPTTLTIPEGSSTSFTIDAYGYDWDGSTLEFDFNCPSTAVATAATVRESTQETCSIASSDITSEAGAQYFDWRVTVTDELGAEASESGRIYAEIEGINHAPKIWRLSNRSAWLSCRANDDGLACTDRIRSGEDVDYTVVATDPDGDPLTYQGEPVAFNENTFEVSVADSAQTIHVTVTDTPADVDNAPISSTASLTITPIANRAPTMYLSLSDYRVIAAHESNEVTVTPYMYDDVDTFAELFAASEVVVSDANGNSVSVPTTQNPSSWTIDTSGLELGNYRVTVTATDSDGASASVSAAFRTLLSNAPQAEAILMNPDEIILDANGRPTIDEVTVSAYLYDDFLEDNFTAELTIIAPDGNTEAFTGALERVNQDQINLYRLIIDLSEAQLEEGTYTGVLTLQDKDNDPVNYSEEIPVSLPDSNVTIDIQ